MTRGGYLRLVAGTLLAVAAIHVARHTYWAEVTLPLPPQGEARSNPFYAAQRFAEALGARTAWDRAFTTPPPRGVVAVSSWHWSLSSRRREALERWVESGGRLVTDALLLGEDDAFERWSGIAWTSPESDPESEDSDAAVEETCRTMSETAGDTPRGGGRYWLCAVGSSSLTSRRPIEWALGDDRGLQAVRVAVGRGSVTVINATPYRDRDVFNGDHGAVLVAAAQLERGDELRFLSEDDHPSLLDLTWQYGASVVVLTLGLVGLAVWRGASRFGPIEPAPETARRSLAEQIRGSGRFVLRYGDGEPLHAAAVRALQEAAARHVPRYARLTRDEQITALAHATAFDREALAAAIHHAGLRRPQELRSTIALIESARRAVVTHHTGRSHGTD
jgi:hypothetical protein